MNETRQDTYRQQVQVPRGGEGWGVARWGERRPGVPVVMSLAEAFGNPGGVGQRPIADRAAPGG
ncbi:hypothetical protein ACL02R_15545 [Streptomyces sp. MS19]|uniref:hypothetical protein n=1 Tax=Streptomyces sp. MS19 TaxID=3385972 RepID=UPI00399FE4CA